MMSKSKAVLIVEDDEEDAILLKNCIQSLNYNCDVSTSSEKAFEAIKTKDYYAAFVDIVLPGLSGTDFIKYLMEQEPNMKIILVSGSAPKVENFPKGHLLSFIIKPVSKTAVQKALL